MKKLITLFLAAGLILTAACSLNTEEITAERSLAPTSELSPEPAPEPTPDVTLAPAKTNNNITIIEPYSDVRQFLQYESETPEEGNYDPEDIKTFWFNLGKR